MNGKNPFEQQRPIEGVKHVILVGSGKGGVGKSTVTANLALALKKLGHKVGILDADLYGPSQPRMFGALNQKPEVDKENRIHPISRYGISLMSIGFLVPEDSALVWRGPMLFKAMDQFFRDVKWGDLDFLLLDLPPGTGDIPLTVAQKVPVSGAITVCTPQNLALVDAKKAMDMFSRVQIPQLGVVENMAYLKVPGTDEPFALFPQGELKSYLDSRKVQHLGSIPFQPNVALACESGIPTVESDDQSEVAKVFKDIAQKITSQLA